MIVWLSIASAANSQDPIDVRREYNVKAAMLYGFGRYITWPEAAFENDTSPFVIGVLGDYPFGDALDRIAARKTIQGRRIQIRRLKATDACPDCQILFVTRTISSEVELAAIRKCSNEYVLLVGESPDFARRGGIINFFLHGDTVRFEFNTEIAQKKQLALNAKLYSLGVRVTSRD
jgi:hypothetical protein